MNFVGILFFSIKSTVLILHRIVLIINFLFSDILPIDLIFAQKRYSIGALVGMLACAPINFIEKKSVKWSIIDLGVIKLESSLSIPSNILAKAVQNRTILT